MLVKSVRQDRSKPCQGKGVCVMKGWNTAREQG